MFALVGVACVRWCFFGALVLDLMEDDFEKTIAKYDVAVVNFHDPEGKDSQDLESNWVQAAQQLKEEGNAIQFVSVDAADNEDLADKYEISSEKKPVIKLFRYGQLDRSVYENFGAWGSKETVPNLVAFARTKVPCE